MPITMTTEELQDRSVEFVQDYRTSLRGQGLPDPEWPDDKVREVVKQLLDEEQYEDDDHIDLVFARDLLWTLEGGESRMTTIEL